MKFSWKNIENWQSWKMRFFGPFEFFKIKKKLLHLKENKQPVHMRYHFFLLYGWFLQNLGKESVRTNMHTTVYLPNFTGSKILAIVCWIENAPSQEEAESFNWNWGSSWGFVAPTEMFQLPCRTKCASPQTIQMFWSMPCPLWKLQSRYFILQ